MKTIKKNQKGFTLIEILVVIGIIAILAAIVLVAINPARQFAQARDSQRDSNVNAILNGIGQYIADHKGTLPDGFPAAGTAFDAVDLCADLVPDYIPAFPTDPTSDHEGEAIEEADCAAADDTLYEVVENDETGRITVTATETETRVDKDGDAVDISVTR